MPDYCSIPNTKVQFMIKPSDTAYKILLYCTECGRFHCSDTYFVDRTPRNDILLLHIENGDFYAVADDTIIELYDSDTVIIDCYVPQIYGTRHGADITWAHIGGNNLLAIKNEILSESVTVFRGGDSCIDNFIERVLYTCISGEIISETALSLSIVEVLYSLLNDTTGDTRSAAYSSVINKAVCYIDEKYGNPRLSIDEIADNSHLSVTHFRRLFKKETGITPHEYIMKRRMSEAKRFLLTESYNVKETAFLTGFEHEVSFIYAFKQSVGTPPGKWAASIKISENT